MSAFRWDIQAIAGPAREALIGGGAQLLVRVRLFNGPGVVDDEGRPNTKPDVFTDLRTEDARRLACELLLACEHAEQQTRAAGYWEHER
jgi:hypothetical protein